MLLSPLLLRFYTCIYCILIKSISYPLSANYFPIPTTMIPFPILCVFLKIFI